MYACMASVRVDHIHTIRKHHFSYAYILTDKIIIPFPEIPIAHARPDNQIYIYNQINVLPT